MPPDVPAASLRRAAFTDRLGSWQVLGQLHTRVGGGSGAHPVRPVVLVVAALVGTAGVAIGVGPAWLVALALGVGLGLVWLATRRDAPAHEQLEAELRLVIRELRESRARVAHVADTERRRIERDLHDGCQQRLIALRVKLGLAEELIGTENESVAELIHDIALDAESALDDLHALVHGIYPSLLVDRGLADALKSMGRSAPMPVHVRAQGSSRYPADVEAAVYFACAEALQNTAKHAGSDATASIAVRHEGSGLAFEVSDDGRGFDDEVHAGSGLANMHDRLSAIGGRLRVTSAAGSGTTVKGWVDEVEPLHQSASTALRWRRQPPPTGVHIEARWRAAAVDQQAPAVPTRFTRQRRLPAAP
jgi:signal transduction histidine kinase